MDAESASAIREVEAVIGKCWQGGVRNHICHTSLLGGQSAECNARHAARAPSYGGSASRLADFEALVTPTKPLGPLKQASQDPGLEKCFNPQIMP